MPTKEPPRPDATSPSASPSGGHGPQFVERMFSGFAHPGEVRVPPAARAAAQPFQPLRESTVRPGGAYRLQPQTPAVRVHADSPAIDVMTDFCRVAAVSIRDDATIDAAQRTMIAERVRALFVVDDAGAVAGILTSTDLSGEKPILLAQQRGLRHDEVPVREAMTPADRLEAMDLDDVLHARVGDVVASLRLSGRQHALVIDTAGTGGPPATRTVRGIFSLTQIARQLGLPPQPGHDVARTFAEIEAAIGAA